MGEVWKARDTRLDRIVAVKTSGVEFSERLTLILWLVKLRLANHPYAAGILHLRSQDQPFAPDRKGRAGRRSAHRAREESSGAPRPIKFPPKKRVPGLFKGEFEIGSSFFEPLPPEELQSWE
jgi:hypothetical protein